MEIIIKEYAYLAGADPAKCGICNNSLGYSWYFNIVVKKVNEYCLKRLSVHKECMYGYETWKLFRYGGRKN